jgi:hypothetical protein
MRLQLTVNQGYSRLLAGLDLPGYVPNPTRLKTRESGPAFWTVSITRLCPFLFRAYARFCMARQKRASLHELCVQGRRALCPSVQ